MVNKLWDPNKAVDPHHVPLVHRISVERKIVLLSKIQEVSVIRMALQDKLSKHSKETVWIISTSSYKEGYRLPKDLHYGVPKQSKRDARLTRRGIAAMQRLGFKSLLGPCSEPREITLEDF